MYFKNIITFKRTLFLFFYRHTLYKIHICYITFIKTPQGKFLYKCLLLGYSNFRLEKALVYTYYYLLRFYATFKKLKFVLSVVLLNLMSVLKNLSLTKSFLYSLTKYGVMLFLNLLLLMFSFDEIYLAASYLLNCFFEILCQIFDISFGERPDILSEEGHSEEECSGSDETKVEPKNSSILVESLALGLGFILLIILFKFN